MIDSIVYMWTHEIPVWAKIAVVIFMFLAIISNVYVFSVCGWEMFVLGNGGFYAAITGLCG